MTRTYQISGMTCGSCVARVKSELLKLGDVASAEVQLSEPQATLSLQRLLPLSLLQDAVSKAGPYRISMYEEKDPEPTGPSQPAQEGKASYGPIYLIFGFITGITLLIQWQDGHFMPGEWMMHFMAGFFLVFSFFKFLDLRGFADGYRSYDIIARAFPAWGFIYPFVELALGLAYLTALHPFYTSLVTLVIMGVSSAGVVRSLLRKQSIRCACLGTVLRVPLSGVTLFEDSLMVIMSALMLLSPFA